MAQKLNNRATKGMLPQGSIPFRIPQRRRFCYACGANSGCREKSDYKKKTAQPQKGSVPQKDANYLSGKHLQSCLDVMPTTTETNDMSLDKKGGKFGRFSCFFHYRLV